MKMIGRLGLGALLLVSMALGGCAQLQTFSSNVGSAYTALTQTKVDARYALVAAETFNTLEVAGTAYLRLPRCGSSTAVCRDPGATKQIIAGFQAGRVARDAVISWVKSNPCDSNGKCPLVPNGIYASLTGTISTLQSVYAKYNVKVGG